MPIFSDIFICPEIKYFGVFFQLSIKVQQKSDLRCVFQLAENLNSTLLFQPH